MKKYIVLGGVNGAGKSTLYQVSDNLKKMPRVNTDEIVKELGDWRNLSDVLKAGKIAVRLIDEYFSKGVSFNQESTLCGKSIIKKFQESKAVRLYYRVTLCGCRFCRNCKTKSGRKSSKWWTWNSAFGY